MPKSPRKKPYTEIGIRRLKCCRCTNPARTQWQICSDGNQFRPLCLPCDFLLNAQVMAFMGLPFDANGYAAKLLADHAQANVGDLVDAAKHLETGRPHERR